MWVEQLFWPAVGVTSLVAIRMRGYLGLMIGLLMAMVVAGKVM